MEDVKEWLNSNPFMSMDILTKLLISLIIIILAWAIRTLVVKILLKRIDDVRSRYIWQKTVTYLVTFLAFLIIGNLWFKGIQEITTFLGLLSAGIAIALKDVFTNFAGWIFIIWVRPFSVGDRIQISNNSGDVIDISMFHTTIMEIGNWVEADQSTGRIIKIPNGMVFTQALANYSKGFQFIWNEIPVMITFESNWEKAKEILLKIANKHAEHLSETAKKRVREASKYFMIRYSKLTPTVYTSVKESGVLLTIRYLCEPRRRRGSEETIWEDILNAFATCDDIDFAYPTQRFYDNIREGKPGASTSTGDEK